jgi:hypothetical protein
MEPTAIPHTLFPPLDDEVESSDAISPELKENFDKLLALLPSPQESLPEQNDYEKCSNRKRKQAQHHSTDGNETESKRRNVHIDSGGKDMKCNRSSEDETIMQRVQLAAETYAVIQSEMSLMLNGIRELEALLETSTEHNSITPMNSASEEDIELKQTVDCHEARSELENPIPHNTQVS